MGIKENIPFQTNRATSCLSRLTKIVLIFSSTTLLISTILYIIYRQKSWIPDSVPGTIIWYSIFVGLFSMLFASITVIVLSFHSRRKQQTIWPSIKKEVVLLILTIILFIILTLTIYIINSADKSLQD